MNKEVKLIESVTKYKHAEVSLGAKVFISNADARGLLKVMHAVSTDNSEGVESQKARNALFAYIHMMCDSVLNNSFEVSSLEDLSLRFKDDVMFSNEEHKEGSEDKVKTITDKF